MERLLDPGSPFLEIGQLAANGMYGDAKDPDGAPGYRALAPLAEILLETAPQRLLWGSDWPHPGWHAQGRPRLDEAALHDWAWRHLDRHGIARKVLIDNPARLYGFTDAPGGSPAGA